MRIVVTSTPKKQKINMESLLIRKAELKQKIREQENCVSVSAKKFFSPVSITTHIFRSFTKGLNVVDGVLIGYRIMRIFKKFFHRSK